MFKSPSLFLYPFLHIYVISFLSSSVAFLILLCLLGTYFSSSMFNNLIICLQFEVSHLQAS